uniref:Regulator of MON1-CCZ1 n=1 Tax=Hippocampus comes TaxID=109280 RepID=A0A3Q2XJC7_HIPCM
MGERHYLELCDNLVHFENASSVNNVFFDEANKQVFAVRSGGATGVVVKGPDDKSSVAFRMEDKGEVKCIKFSIGNKILAVQRTSKSVDFINFIPDYPHTEFTHECKVSRPHKATDPGRARPSDAWSCGASSDEERRPPGVLLDHLERDRLCQRPGHRVLPGSASAASALLSGPSPAHTRLAFRCFPTSALSNCSRVTASTSTGTNTAPRPPSCCCPPPCRPTSCSPSPSGSGLATARGVDAPTPCRRI